jgi:hypothetical protein
MEHVHEKFLTFALDPRNVHLALAENGVIPFKLTHLTWSTWLVMLLNYNLPRLTINFFHFIGLVDSKERFCDI